jgi:hypothetical protein
MQKSTAPNNSFDENGSGEAGADAVQKTTWVVGKGTDDRANRIAEEPGEVSSASDRDAAPRRGTEGSEDA